VDFFHKFVNNALKRNHQDEREVPEYSPIVQKMIEAGELEVPEDACYTWLLEPGHEEALRSMLQAILDHRQKSEE
jgi:predicted kinase